MVTFEDRETAAAYANETGIDVPMLIDQGRGLYAAYGAGRARWRHLVGPTTLRAYAREAWRGVWPRLPEADPVQQGSDVLIDPTGIVRFHHVGAGSGYRPPIDTILAVIRSARR